VVDVRMDHLPDRGGRLLAGGVEIGRDNKRTPCVRWVGLVRLETCASDNSSKGGATSTAARRSASDFTCSTGLKTVLAKNWPFVPP